MEGIRCLGRAVIYNPIGRKGTYGGHKLPREGSKGFS
jgi:hypothetical protein